MDNQNAKDLISLAENINRHSLLTEYLKHAKRGFVCIECGNGSGNNGTGAVVKNNKLKCGKCQHSFNNIDIIAHHLHLSNRGKDFVEIVKFGCQLFGIDFPTSNVTVPKHNSPKPVPAKVEKAEPFGRLAEAQRNLEKFIQSEGGKWRGLSLETLQRMNAGFLPDVYFPAAKKNCPPLSFQTIWAASTSAPLSANFTKITSLWLPRQFFCQTKKLLTLLLPKDKLTLPVFFKPFSRLLITFQSSQLWRVAAPAQGKTPFYLVFSNLKRMVKNLR